MGRKAKAPGGVASKYDSVDDEKARLKARFAEKMDQYSAERDLANQMIGRIHMSNGFAKLATVSSLRDLKVFKERKLYKVLGPIEVDGKPETVSSWEQFCNLLGVSRRHVDEQISNLNELGEDAIEAMNKIGLGYRDLRKLRKIDGEDRQIVYRELEANLDDPESVKNLIDDILAEQKARHDRETKRLQDKIEEDAGILESRDRLIEEHSATINELKGKDALPAQKQDEENAKALETKRLEVVGALISFTNTIHKIMTREDASESLLYTAASAVKSLLIDLEKTRDDYHLAEIENQADAQVEKQDDSWMLEKYEITPRKPFDMNDSPFHLVEHIALVHANHVSEKMKLEDAVAEVLGAENPEAAQWFQEYIHKR